MRLFGFSITRDGGEEKALGPVVSQRGGWWPIVREYFAGAWQQNAPTISPESVLANHAVFACQTLIASDISKLRVKLVAQDSDGIWSEVKNPAYSPVLRKPNGYQTRIQFFEGWALSKLQRGNTYVLKRRDGRGVVVGLYVLAPDLVTPLVSDSGEVFYELNADNLSGVDERIVVPAREIIHDRFNCLFHPLVGLSPVFANGLAATQGLAIQNASTILFQNGARPGGLLTAPGEIADETAARLKAYWDSNFSGSNAGKVAVLGDGLKYEAMSMKSTDAQLIEQLKWSAEVVCSTYHIPPYKIGVGAMPSYNNVQALNTEYYSQCLQVLIEAIELCLDEGLGIGDGVVTNGVSYGTEFDIENLLRMDSVTQMQVLKEGAGILKIDEMRAKLDKKPVPGGDAVYLQQQNYSLEALAKRDAQEDPFTPGASAQSEPVANDNEAEMQAQRALIAMMKGLPSVRR
jgi:HK97 family phage portal protein